MRTCDREWQPLQKNVTRKRKPVDTAAALASLTRQHHTATPATAAGQGVLPHRGQWPEPLRSHRPAGRRPWQTEDLRPDPPTGNEEGSVTSTNRRLAQVQSLAIYWDSEEAGAGWQVGLGDELSVLAFKEMIEEASSVDVGYS